MSAFDIYALLKVQKNRSLNYETYKMIANLMNPLISIRNGHIHNIVEAKWDSNTTLWTFKKNRMLYRLFLLSKVSNEKRNEAISVLKEMLLEPQSITTFYEMYENKVLEFIEKLNDNGINTIFIKAKDNLPLDSHNIDLLIGEKDKFLAESILQNVGFTKVYFCEEPYKTLYRYTRNAEDYLAFHLHTKISWYGIEFVDAKKVWESYNLKKVKGVEIGFPHMTDHILITVAHKFFEDAEITLKEVIDIVDSIEKGCGELKKLEILANEGGWEDILLMYLMLVITLYKDLYGELPSKTAKMFTELIETSKRILRADERRLLYKKLNSNKKFLPLSLDPEFIEYRRRKIIELGFYNKKLSTSRLIFAGNTLRLVLKRLFIGDKECSPFVIAIEGIDGSGKTEHSQCLLKDFYDRGKKAIYIWSSGTLPFVDKIRILLSKKSQFISGCEPSVNTKSNYVFFDRLMQNAVFNFLFSMATIVNYNLEILIKILLAKSSYDIIVLDRFIHDTIVRSVYYYRGEFGSLLSRILLSYPAMIPRPNITVILYSKPHIIRARRQNELTCDEIVKKLAVYKQYSVIWGANLMDSSPDFHYVHRNLLQKILEKYYGKRT
jgi:thymidylate kinase